MRFYFYSTRIAGIQHSHVMFFCAIAEIHALPRSSFGIMAADVDVDL